MTRGKYAARAERRVESETVVELTVLLERAQDENARLEVEWSNQRREIETLRSKLTRDVAALAGDRVVRVQADAGEVQGSPGRERDPLDEWLAGAA